MSQRGLARGAAMFLAGGLAAGCSSDVSRFHDSLFTNSTGSQTAAVSPAAQPYPGGGHPGLDGTYTGSVNRTAVQPATQRGAGLPRPVPQQDIGGGYGAQVYVPPYPAAPTTSAVLPQPPAVDRTFTASTPAVTERRDLPVAARPENQPMPQVVRTAAAPTVAAPNRQVGWGASGGTEITVRSGETVYNLARRYGVPANAILEANGLRDGAALQAGSRIIIPAYAYANNAPVSAPDNNPHVADAKSSRGTKFDVPAEKVPMPTQAPAERLAVLPQTPRVKESEATPQAAMPQDPTRKAAKSGGQGEYVVVSGDTLHGIARKTGTTATALKEANGLDSGLIRIGQKLRVPAGAGLVQTASAPKNIDPMVTGGTSRTQPKEEKVAVYTPPAKQRTSIDQAVEEKAGNAPSATGIGKMRWPVLGRVISAYGANTGGKANDGIDIAVPEGTPVKAAENGVVIYAGDGLKEFGNTVLVRHENGLVTVYGHASEVKVSRGDTVRRGQEIARSGMSGSADAPKLHFEVRKDSAPVDPSKFLE